MIDRIEIEFALPVELTDAEMRALNAIVQSIAKRRIPDTDFLYTALVLRSAIDPLIEFVDHRRTDFPYAKVRKATLMLIGSPEDDVRPRRSYDVMMRQQRHARAWITLLGEMEAAMLHAHGEGRI